MSAEPNSTPKTCLNRPLEYAGSAAQASWQDLRANKFIVRGHAATKFMPRKCAVVGIEVCEANNENPPRVNVEYAAKHSLQNEPSKCCALRNAPTEALYAQLN